MPINNWWTWGGGGGYVREEKHVLRMAFNNKIQYIKTEAATRNLNSEAVPERTRIRRMVRLDSIERQEVARQMRVCVCVWRYV